MSGRVSRDAYADAFRRVTGHPLAALPQLAGRSDTEIFFESLYLNDVPTGDDEVADAELLARYCWELEAAFVARAGELLRAGPAAGRRGGSRAPRRPACPASCRRC